MGTGTGSGRRCCVGEGGREEAGYRQGLSMIDPSPVKEGKRDGHEQWEEAGTVSGRSPVDDVLRVQEREGKGRHRDCQRPLTGRRCFVRAGERREGKTQGLSATPHR